MPRSRAARVSKSEFDSGGAIERGSGAIGVGSSLAIGVSSGAVIAGGSGLEIGVDSGIAIERGSGVAAALPMIFLYSEPATICGNVTSILLSVG